MKLRRRETVGLQLVTALGAAALLFPFLWMISASLQTLQEVEAFPPIWIPEVPQWTNYVEAVVNYNIGRALLNSAIVTTVSVVGQLTVCSLGAYAFSRLRFPGRDLLFTLFLATLMIPGTVTLTSSFLILARFNWIDTYAALIVPHAASGFAIFLLRQFFMTIPTELEEAAHLDGAGRLRFLWSIVLPLSRPALTTVFVFIFISTYNAFLWPLVVTSSERLRVIQIALSIFSDSIDGGSTAGGQLLAASVLTMLPTIILFMIFQNAFIRGITRTGLK